MLKASQGPLSVRQLDNDVGIRLPQQKSIDQDYFVMRSADKIRIMIGHVRKCATIPGAKIIEEPLQKLVSKLTLPASLNSASRKSAYQSPSCRASPSLAALSDVVHSPSPAISTKPHLVPPPSPDGSESLSHISSVSSVDSGCDNELSFDEDIV